MQALFSLDRAGSSIGGKTRLANAETQRFTKAAT
jgi:hypothetical protein